MSCTSKGTKVGRTDPQTLIGHKQRLWHASRCHGNDIVFVQPLRNYSKHHWYELMLVAKVTATEPLRVLQSAISPTGRCLRCDAHTFQNFLEPLLEIRKFRIGESADCIIVTFHEMSWGPHNKIYQFTFLLQKIVHNLMQIIKPKLLRNKHGTGLCIKVETKNLAYGKHIPQ